VKGAMGRGSIEYGSFQPHECEGCPIGPANRHVFEFNQSVSDDAITLERIDSILDDLKRLIQKHHPDKPGGDEKVFKELRKRQKELKKARKLMVTAIKEDSLRA